MSEALRRTCRKRSSGHAERSYAPAWNAARAHSSLSDAWRRSTAGCSAASRVDAQRWFPCARNSCVAACGSTSTLVRVCRARRRWRRWARRRARAQRSGVNGTATESRGAVLVHRDVRSAAKAAACATAFQQESRSSAVSAYRRACAWSSETRWVWLEQRSGTWERSIGWLSGRPFGGAGGERERSTCLCRRFFAARFARPRRRLPGRHSVERGKISAGKQTAWRITNCRSWRRGSG